MKFLDSKAQASAPFELFVAVIIMGFVVVMGYLVLNTVNTEICLNQVDKEMGTFKLNLEDSAQRKSSKLFTFLPPAECFDSKDTIMKIQLETDKTCADRCGSMMSECYVMTFSNINIPNAFKQKCIDLPNYTSFLTESPSCDDATLASDGYCTINPLKEGAIGIPPGPYVIRNISTAGDQFPKLCIWYKGGSEFCHQNVAPSGSG